MKKTKKKTAAHGCGFHIPKMNCGAEYARSLPGG